ncbi:sialate O-acetylesterase [Clavibacter sp. MX14-G9D]|uniref:sialate O-acetylesterase n=1 Tax=Clavibacter sp. MX14-G9D TaxID=3064656 RepID=UPI00293EDC6A|nr:sialate O-acetylesterase [Clavibacter sp. MX14-G9D]
MSLLVAVQPAAEASAAATGPTRVVVAPDEGAGTPSAASMMRILQATAALAPFTATPAPVIAGTAVVGQRLTATTARWTPAATTIRYAWLVDGVPVTGQTSTAYTVRAADAGAVVTVAVTGSRSGHEPTTQTSAPTAAVPVPVVAAFTAAPRPTVAGTPQVGFTLTARAGTWTPWPAFSYSWTRDGMPIGGQTGVTYRVTDADAGTAIAVTVTGTKAGYATRSLTSTELPVPAASTPTPAPTAPAPEPTPPPADVPYPVASTPTIAGTAQVGFTLSARAGVWTPWPAFSYRWTRDGVAIPDQTAVTYRVQEGDQGTTIAVTVTGTKAGYVTQSLDSAGLLVPLPEVAPPPPAPEPEPEPVPDVAFEAAPDPSMTGIGLVDYTLTVKAGTWAPWPSFAYQWLRDGVPIPDQTGPAYRVVAGDVGTSIAVAVTGTKAGYVTETRTSPGTPVLATPVPPPPPAPALPFEATPAPEIQGTAVAGGALRAQTPAWTPEATAYSYSWARDGVAVLGATDAAYAVRRADAGTRITVTVTGTRTGYQGASRTSEPTAVVVDAFDVPPAQPVPAPGDEPFAAAPAPAITGTASVGSTLTAETAAWTPAATTLTYVWKRNGVVVPGRTAATYVPAPRDAGSQVTVTVTGSAAGSAPTSRTSAARTVESTGEGYDVVVVLGQSNAQGVGTGWDPAVDVSVPGLDQLAGSGTRAGQIVPAKDSLSHVTTWTTTGGVQSVGPGMQLGRRLLADARPGRKVLIVPAAMASTSMTGDGSYAWNPADTRSRVNLFTRALGQIDQALAQDPDNRLVAVVWAQGESDATRTDAAGYQGMLLDLVDRLGARYGEVPFLIGGMVPEWLSASPLRQAIDTAQQGMPALRSNVSYVPGAAGHSRVEDSIHYTAAGARAMGDKYFAAYQRATGAVQISR